MSEQKQTFHVGDIGSNPIGDATDLRSNLRELHAGRSAEQKSANGQLSPISPQSSHGIGSDACDELAGDGECAQSDTSRRLVRGATFVSQWRYLRGLYTSERRALKEARSRCYTRTNKDYADYGGRGIRVTKEWSGDIGFARFLDHIGPKPSSWHSLNRIDNARGYVPGNVRWVDRREQANNRRSSRMVEWDGEVMTAAELGRLVGLARQEIIALANRGWFALPESP